MFPPMITIGLTSKKLVNMGPLGKVECANRFKLEELVNFSFLHEISEKNKIRTEQAFSLFCFLFWKK